MLRYYWDKGYRGHWIQSSSSVSAVSTFSANLFNVGVGLHQSCAFSPFRFAIFTDRILNCSQGWKDVLFGGLTMMSSFWIHPSMTLTSVHSSAKQLGWESAVPDQKLWLSSIKELGALFRRGYDYIWWWSSRVLWSCLAVVENGTVRVLRGLGLYQAMVMMWKVEGLRTTLLVCHPHL